MRLAPQNQVGELKEIDGFPEYGIDVSGNVVTFNSGLLRKRSLTQEGAVKITLFRDGRPYTKSLSLLVARAWLYNDYDPDIFDTPIHLDNDLTNVYVDNLRWRPRWFAVKYQRQYWNEEYRFATTKIKDRNTGEEYKGFMEVCQKYGLLYMDVIASCTRGTEVFPTWKSFEFI